MQGARQYTDYGQLVVVGDVFDQLNRGFRQEEVNVHRLSVRTSLGELSCMFTCLLLQVVQTGRLPFQPARIAQSLQSKTLKLD